MKLSISCVERFICNHWMTWKLEMPLIICNNDCKVQKELITFVMNLARLAQLTQSGNLM